MTLQESSPAPPAGGAWSPQRMQAEERQLDALEEEVRGFAGSLAEVGAEEGDLQASEGRLRLFLLHYLHGHAHLSLSRVGPRDVIDFAGTWYLRHVANVTPDSIRSLLSTLASFFRWRARRGRLDETLLAEITRVCEKEAFFLDRFEEYGKCLDDEAAFETWLEKRWGWVNLGTQVTPRVSSPLAPDPGLLEALPKGPLPALADDFTTLLNVIRETRPRLNRSGRKLLGSAVAELNRHLPEPDKLPPRPRQEHAPRVNAIYTAAAGLGLCGPGRGGNVAPRPDMDLFLGLEEPEQFVLLLDALWNIVPWGDLVPPPRRRAAPTAYDGRAWLARILAMFPVGAETALGEDVATPRQRLAAILEGEPGFFRCLLPVLTRGGLWQPRLSSTAQGRQARTKLLSLQITSLGHRVLHVWSREALGGKPAAPFDGILQGQSLPSDETVASGGNGKG